MFMQIKIIKQNYFSPHLFAISTYNYTHYLHITCYLQRRIRDLFRTCNMYALHILNTHNQLCHRNAKRTLYNLKSTKSKRLYNLSNQQKIPNLEALYRFVKLSSIYIQLWTKNVSVAVGDYLNAVGNWNIDQHYSFGEKKPIKKTKPTGIQI